MDPEIIHVDHLKRVHDSDYVDSFLNDKMDIQMLKKIGLGVSSSTGTIGKDVYDRVMHVIGATLQASRISLENADGRAANLSGGAHHAFRGYGSGYCVFNDIVVAGEALISEGKIERYLVVDLDVHQGDGTAAMLEGNPNAFTFSMHCENNFPMVKKKSSWDVALPDFTGDEQYLSTLDKCLKHMLQNRNKSFNYDFVFYQSGVDVLSGDGLGRLSLTMEGIRQRDELVSQFIAQSSCPVTVVMGGGYPKGDHTAHVVATAHAQTIEMMNRDRKSVV